MATFRVEFILGNSLEDVATIVAAKIPKSTMKKLYGSSEDREIYRCHKNEYGIVYLCRETSSWGGQYWAISDDPSKAVKRLPRYTKLFVKQY